MEKLKAAASFFKEGFDAMISAFDTVANAIAAYPKTSLIVFIAVVFVTWKWL